MRFIQELSPSVFLLPIELNKFNFDGRLNEIINKPRQGYYHDFKFDLVDPDSMYPDPKTQLLSELEPFPELENVRQSVIDGIFDDRADASDWDRMALEFEDNPSLVEAILGPRPSM